MDAAPATEDDPFEAQRERTANPMWRLFREYGVRYPREIALGIGSSLAARILDLLPPLVLALAIDTIFPPDATFSLPLVPAGWVPNAKVGQLWLAAGIIAVSFFGGAAFHWMRNWGWNAFAQGVQHDVRTDTYDRMQRLNMTFFADKQTGEMMSVLSNDVNRLERFLNDGLNSAFRLAVMVVGIAGILLYWNWQLALVALVPVPLIALFTYKFVQTIQPQYAEVRSSVGQLNSRLENNLGGVQVIKTSTAEPYESDRVADASQDYYDANWDATRTRITFFPGLRIVAGVGFVVTFLVGGLWVISGPPWPFSGALTTGQFVGFILYTQRFVWPMAQFLQKSSALIPNLLGPGATIVGYGTDATGEVRRRPQHA